jgi:hypothetical protein
VKAKLSVGEQEILRKPILNADKDRYETQREEYLQRGWSKLFFTFVILGAPGLNLPSLNATTEGAKPKSGLSRQSQKAVPVVVSESKPTDCSRSSDDFSSFLDRANIIKTAEVNAKIFAIKKAAVQDTLENIHALKKLPIRIVISCCKRELSFSGSHIEGFSFKIFSMHVYSQGYLELQLFAFTSAVLMIFARSKKDEKSLLDLEQSVGFDSESTTGTDF